MAKGRTLIGIPQIGMGIELKNGDFGITGLHRLNSTKGDAVLATQHYRDLPIGHNPGNGLPDRLHHLRRPPGIRFERRQGMDPGKIGVPA